MNGCSKGDRVKYMTPRGWLTGTVDAVWKDDGDCTEGLDQIAYVAGGVPIGRLELVSLSRLQPFAPGEVIETAPPVSPPARPARQPCLF